MDNETLTRLQQILDKNGIDAWLLYDFHAGNDIALRITGISGHVTRRSAFLVPKSGDPVAVVHNIDQGVWRDVAVEKRYFSDYQTFERQLADCLAGLSVIAMEYSPRGRLPYVAKVDAGTIEFVRECGVTVVSSADLVAQFDACLTDSQIEFHRAAAEIIYRIQEEAFAFVRDRLADGVPVTEYDVQNFIYRRFEAEHMVTDYPPICAIGENAGDPHYEPTVDKSAAIMRGQLLLIDLWARFDKPDAVMADITWMGFTGETVPREFSERFALLCSARDAAVDFIRSTWGTRDVRGCEVDDACRAVIGDAGLADYFVHRTGHSIGVSVHGSGPNIDNMETEDSRVLRPGHLFSVEPGLYTDAYGMRTEIDVLITPDGPEVTTQPVQKKIVTLFD